MGLRQSDRACLTQGKGARALGQGPFHPSPSGIDGLERCCRLALSSDLEGLVWRLGSELHRPGTRLGLGTSVRAQGTRHHGWGQTGWRSALGLRAGGPGWESIGDCDALEDT